MGAEIGVAATVIVSLVIGILGFIRGMRSDVKTEASRDRESMMIEWRTLVSAITADNKRKGDELALLRSELDQQRDERREDKLEDWRRQDEVATRVMEVADRQIAEAAEQDSKLEEIHTLVNSNLTAAISAQLEATRAQLTLLEEAGNNNPAREATVRAKVTELEEVLRDRQIQTDAAAAERERGQ